MIHFLMDKVVSFGMYNEGHVFIENDGECSAIYLKKAPL